MSFEEETFQARKEVFTLFYTFSVTIPEISYIIKEDDILWVITNNNRKYHMTLADATKARVFRFLTLLLSDSKEEAVRKLSFVYQFIGIDDYETVARYHATGIPF